MNSIVIEPSAPVAPSSIDEGYQTDISIHIDDDLHNSTNSSVKDLEKECSICSICLEHVNDGVEQFIMIDCKCKMNKICHAKCIFEWLEKNKKCPTCSDPISASQIYCNFDEYNDSKDEDDNKENERNIKRAANISVDREGALNAYMSALERRNQFLRRQRRLQLNSFRHEFHRESDEERDARHKRNCCIVSSCIGAVVYLILRNL